MNALLKNKVAIVTGASSGIGRATAKLFAREGAAVIVGARRQAELEELILEIEREGGRGRALSGDVSLEAYHESLVSLALSEFGQLDIAFNNAGTLGTAGPVTTMSLEDWESTLRVNLTGAFLGAKHQIPPMLDRGGAVIFVSSFVGYQIGFPSQAAYGASKAGLIGLTRSLASEYGANKIRVNALLPGGTETAMAEEFGVTGELRKRVESFHALGRLASPEEIARSALYLASDLSSFTTGSALFVDGGVTVVKS